MIIDTGLGWSCDDSYLCTESGLVGSVSGRGYYKTNSVAAIVIFCRSRLQYHTLVAPSFPEQ